MADTSNGASKSPSIYPSVNWMCQKKGSYEKSWRQEDADILARGECPICGSSMQEKVNKMFPGDRFDEEPYRVCNYRKERKKRLEAAASGGR